jgi:hypothetical protein|tara:strand:- start:525 stop:1022 length:498 start_codon:yes stop_codon:yes gene_type:complete
MAAPKGYRPAGIGKGKPTVHFYDKPKAKKTKIEDKLPKGMTAEQFKEKYSKIVWCNYYRCMHNVQPEGAKRKIATLLDNPQYEPLGPKEAMIEGVCSKVEIGIKYREIKTSGGVKHKVPECFNAADNKNKHNMDFSKLIQSDGSPFGGSIESGNADTGWSDVAYK